MSSFRSAKPPLFRAALIVLGCTALVGGSPVLVAAQAPTQSVDDSAPTVRIDSLLDLPTVIARTLAVSPDVTVSREDVRMAQSERRVANAEYFPTLTANSGLLNSNVTSVPTDGTLPASAYSVGLAASVDLFTGGRRGADRARAAADIGAAESRDISARYQTTYAAQVAFYETLRAGDLVDVARARVAEAGRSLRYAQDRVRAGTTTRSDELRAQLELTSARQQLLAVTDTLQAAAYSLGRLVGADGPVAGRRPGSLEPVPLALADTAVVRLAVEQSPSVQAALAAQRSADAAIRSVQSVYVPDIKVTGGYNWASQSSIVSAVRPGWALLLSTSYPLFNGYHREDDVTRAQSAAEVARAQGRDLEREVRAEAARLLSSVRYAAQNIALAEEAVQSSTEDLRVQTERYRAGISTELDQLTSELAQSQAQASLVMARYNYQLIRAQLEALVGRSL